jgi:hypothetical protein
MKPQILLITLLVVVCLTISTASAACNDGFCYGTHNSHQNSQHNSHPYKNTRPHTGSNYQTYSGSSCTDCNGSNCNSGNCFSGCNNNCTSCGSSCPNGNCETTQNTGQPTSTTYSGVTSYNPHEGNIYEVGGDGQRLVLTNYANAADPTYQQLLDFIKSDKTDELPYTNTFVCSDFAEALHNNAEKAGIKCAWVGCDFTQGKGHAFNEFNTTDRGIVYIDCTGVPSPDGNQDKILSCAIEQPLTAEYLFRSNYYSAGSMGTVEKLHIFW